MCQDLSQIIKTGFLIHIKINNKCNLAKIKDCEKLIVSFPPIHRKTRGPDGPISLT